MSDKHFVGLKLTGFEDNGKQRPISRVTLKRDDENAVTAGDDTGVELIADCPHATQAMCNDILRRVKGYSYQAYRADDTNLDPAAELGDGITASGVYSVISRINDDGSGYAGAVAPGDPELEDEFPTDGPLTQEFNRRFGSLRSYINKTASEIQMGVVDDLNELEASFTISLNGIKTQINDLDGNISRVEQKADSYNLNIRNDMKKLETSINVSLEGIETSIRDDINGLETSFNMSLTEIRTSIRDAEGNISTLQQTATSLSSQISGVDNRVSSISQSLDSITLSVSNGEDSSTISLVKDGVSVSSKTIKFTGRVVFESDLQNGTTSIDGGCIDTGSIYVGGNNRGVGEIVIDYGSNQGVGQITSSRDGIEIESILSGIVIAASDDILMECGGGITINPSGDLIITARDIEITAQRYFTIDGAPSIWDPTVYLTESRYYTFETDGIHYHSSAGESVTTMVPK